VLPFACVLFKRQNLVVKQNDYKSRDFTQPDLGLGAGGLPGGGGPALMPGGMPPQGMGGMGGMGGGPGMMPPQMGGGGGMMGGPPGSEKSPVVLVSHLDPEKVTPEVLFTLFGVYGDVIRVKILYKQRENALVQFASAQQADYARINLNGCPLFGQEIQVANSRHINNIQMPREAEGKELTRDFTGSEFHRYRKKMYINPKNMNQPSAVLHVANIHELCTEQELRDLFGAQVPGARVAVEFFKTNRSQAYVSVETVPNGVFALINLHNFKLREYPLRVSFAPKTPETIVNSDGAP